MGCGGEGRKERRTGRQMQASRAVARNGVRRRKIESVADDNVDIDWRRGDDDDDDDDYEDEDDYNNNNNNNDRRGDCDVQDVQ